MIDRSSVRTPTFRPTSEDDMRTASRRAVLSGIASAPTLAASALATEPNPVLAAIEGHRRAVVVFEAVIDEVRELEDSILPERRTSIAMEPNCDADLEINPNDDPLWQDHCKRYQVTITELDNAAYGLCKVQLSSITGLVALCEYVTSREEWELPDDFHIVFVASLPDMLKALVRIA
jgi:hypothetical protein